MPQTDATDKTPVFDTRTAHQILLGGLDNIQNSLKDASIERKVEVGSVLWELGNRLKTVLDAIKEDIREQAAQDLEGQVGTTTIQGDDLGSATVLVPSASLRIPKGKDLESLKKILGARFPSFFEEIVTFKPHQEFETRVEGVPDAIEQKALLEAVERHELTPRVSFRRDLPSRRGEE